MSDTLWGDLATLAERMDRLEERVEQLAGSTPAELLGTVEGLRCALAVVERRERECEAKQEMLSEAIGGPTPDR